MQRTFAHLNILQDMNIITIFSNGEPIMFGTAIDDLWGHLNKVVYQQVPTTPDDMKHRIADACASMAPDTLAGLLNQ